MPGWHDASRELRESGAVQFIGLVQEQHGDRAQLFMQWKQMNWPILVDSLNLLGVTVVPITLLIDENGVIVERARRANRLAEFVGRAPATPEPAARQRPDLQALANGAETGDDFRTLGDAHFLHGVGSGAARWDSAAAAYRKAIEIDADDARAHFRLGATLRRRSETERRRRTDFGAAVDSWRAALERSPNNYIWQRRIQQYGPALAKPYPFYDWVPKAIADIRARGETPVELAAPLTDSESLAKGPFIPQEGPPKNPDPNGRINSDEKQWVEIETAAAPAVGRADAALRVHVALRPDLRRKIHWNNESEPLRVWLEAPKGWRVNRSLTTIANADSAESVETRRFEVELQPPSGSKETQRLRGFALYNVCEGVGGTCRLLRQDFVIELRPHPRQR